MQINETRAKQVQVRSESALFNLGSMMVIGLILSAIYGGFNSIPASSVTGSVSIAMLLAACSTFIGGLIGFLFGVPRSLQDGQEQGRKSRYSSNTNLEQISDWLTKILVGVGLTQLRDIPAKLSNLCINLGPSFNGGTGGQVFVGTVVLFFLVGGFLYGYLWTRLFLVLFLNETDALSELKDAVGQEIKLQVEQVREESSHTVAALTSKLDDLEAQSEQNARALTLVARQLNAQDAPSPESGEELKAALAKASRLTRLMAFNEAKNQRKSTWASEKPRMALTIPIFEALIETDEEGEFQIAHAQLGYALKDKPEPDWAGAEQELSKAIALRGSAHGFGGDYYHFNRAICLIHLDEAFLKGQPSDPDSRHQIESDLRVVKRGRTAWLLGKSSEVSKWLGLNGIADTELESVP